MSKKEYADQTRTYTAYFRAGEHQERMRILALLDEKIAEIKKDDTYVSGVQVLTLEAIKRQLEK